MEIASEADAVTAAATPRVRSRVKFRKTNAAYQKAYRARQRAKQRAAFEAALAMLQALPDDAVIYIFPPDKETQNGADGRFNQDPAAQ